MHICTRAHELTCIHILHMCMCLRILYVCILYPRISSRYRKTSATSLLLDIFEGEVVVAQRPACREMVGFSFSFRRGFLGLQRRHTKRLRKKSKVKILVRIINLFESQKGVIAMPTLSESEKRGIIHRSWVCNSIWQIVLFTVGLCTALWFNLNDVIAKWKRRKFCLSQRWV